VQRGIYLAMGRDWEAAQAECQQALSCPPVPVGFPGRIGEWLLEIMHYGGETEQGRLAICGYDPQRGNLCEAAQARYGINLESPGGLRPH